ncbi:RNA (cytosine-C(5)-)-methyltransferase [Aeropyrum pernix K1]|uniref:RNA (Cytosine-C(5)-)-methyltransferase n=1 Tax=Aeropyrum pernix (strain ATCC 700893 / DSM 11879 / JCM 9820 / NBRC 100138 / K1) TaxID=272557 RepID=Q9Y919_AERPE|nr:RsmB/NOP family class I SAM-dependent RNA methyltransferase [Aeropyrum pernix]BAA81481.2 RNA (cytosine-C(5)-)-methyltransferase [Aeropyrum pernix K1]
MLTYGPREIRALLEALEAAERRKPAQVSKREVFARHGLLGSKYDRVFTAIMYKMFRMQGVLDRAVAHALGVRPEDVIGFEPMLRQALRLSAYLAQFDETRDRRLISALLRHGLPLLASRYGWRKARLVHKVLERLIDEPWKPSTREEEFMARYMVPIDIVIMARRVVAGDDELEKLLDAINRPPVNSVRVNTLKASFDEVYKAIRSSGLYAWPSDRVEGVIRYRGPFNDTLARLLAEGKIVPQDESSAAAAPLLQPRPGEIVLDMCAAPGGKTTHLAELSRLQARILGFDIYWDRLRRMKTLVEATASEAAVAVVKADAANAPKILGRGSVDKILLDPPCSTTGGLHKNVDARWRLTRRKIMELQELQKTLLDAAVETVKPGGLILYTVCSILAEEGEDVVLHALEKWGNLEIVPLNGPYDESPILPGTMRAWPHRHGVTGFFYALLRKKG